jgi:cell division septum initiation protein DivIVA
MEILKMRKENKVLMEKDKSVELAKVSQFLDEVSKELEGITNANRELQDQIKKKKENTQ